MSRLKTHLRGEKIILGQKRGQGRGNRLHFESFGGKPKQTKGEKVFRETMCRGTHCRDTHEEKCLLLLGNMRKKRARHGGVPIQQRRRGHYMFQPRRSDNHEPDA